MALDRIAPGSGLIEALVEQGIADNNTRRVIIDIPAAGIVTIYRENIGTRHLYNIVNKLGDAGYEIRTISDPVVGGNTGEPRGLDNSVDTDE